MKHFLFGDTCSVWWCIRKPWRWLRISMPGTKKFKEIGYCEKHARIVDAVLRNDEVEIPTDYHYTPL